MKWRKTKTILDALKTLLESLVFPEGHALEGDNIFKSVQLYDIPDLETALKDLLEFNDRICLVVTAGDFWRNEQKGNEMRSHRTGEIILIMSDQDYAPGKASFFGNGTQPGIINFKEDVMEAITGETLGIQQCVIIPGEGVSLRFAKEDGKLDSSREGYRAFLKVNMGTQAFKLSRGTSLNNG